MCKFTFVAAALILAGPATAAQQGSTAPRIAVELSNYSFKPKQVRLKAGQPVILHLVNATSKTHTFTAPEFFASAAMQPGTQPVGGGIRLGGGETKDIALTPKAGRYKLKCTRPFHKMMGMSGEIIVD